MEMSQPRVIDVTMEQLHRYFLDHISSKPQNVQDEPDISALMQEAVTARWPGLTANEACYMAEHLSLLRKCTAPRPLSDSKAWVDTSPQGSLFSEGMHVPRFVATVGGRKLYCESDPHELLVDLCGRRDTQKLQVDSARARLAQELAFVDVLDEQIRKIEEWIATAERNGIDVATLRLRRVD